MNYGAIAFYSQIVAAVLFAASIVWVWAKFIAPSVLAAQEKNNAQIAEAERHRDEAKAALDALQSEISAAERDAQTIKARAASLAAGEIAKAVAESRDIGVRAVRNAQGELARSRAAARERMREQMLEAALELARSEAGRRISPPVNARLVESFVESLERGGRN